MVRCTSGDLLKITYFIVNTNDGTVSACGKKLSIHHASFICEAGPHHIIRVEETNEHLVFPVTSIYDKVFFMTLNDTSYIAYLPNLIGHGIFK